MPFIDSAELALILGQPHATVHRHLTDLLADGIASRVIHGAAHLPSSHRYFLTAQGIRVAAGVLGFDTPSDFVQAYPMSREWLTLLIRRMDAVASVYRLASSLSPGSDGLRTHVEFHRRGRFDATITLHDGRDFGVVRQGLALRRRSLYDRLRAIAEYDHSRRPDTVLILVPSVWEQRLTARSCEQQDSRDCFVGVESRAALERRSGHVWLSTSFLIGGRHHTLEGVISHASRQGRAITDSPERKRASIPRPERMMQTAPTFGLAPSEKRTLDLITDHPMIPREHLATWLGVSEGRISQMVGSLVKTWDLIERRGKRGDVRYTLSSSLGAGLSLSYLSNFLGPPQSGARSSPPTKRAACDTWARQTRHADGITWFLSKLEAETRTDPASELQWSVPTARSDRAYNWGRSAIAPDAVGHLLTDGHHVPFYLEHELRARHPQGVIARLGPYENYYWSPDHEEDQPPYPVTLFVVDTEEVEDTYMRTAARMNRMSLPILVSCIPVLSDTGILGPSWRPLWEAESSRLALSGLRAYRWDSLYHRMRHRPIEGHPVG